MSGSELSAVSGCSHAVYSPSSAYRWLRCPGSAVAESLIDEDHGSPWADEGSRAHEIAAICLKDGVNVPIDAVGYESVQQYVDYIRERMGSSGCASLVEHRVGIGAYIEECFGTLDCALVFDDGTAHIFDLKFGVGELVGAEDNPQLRLYALGLLGAYPALKTFHLHIVQPRRESISYSSLEKDELLAWGEWVRSRVAIAPERIPGEIQCKWCKAKGSCEVFSNCASEALPMTKETKVLRSLPSVDDMSEEQKKAILDNKKLIESFLEMVESSVTKQLEDGGTFEGYKLVAGRTYRRWTPEAQVELPKALGVEAYKGLIGVIEAEKKLGRDAVAALTYKPEGKPTLVPESDKRPRISGQNALSGEKVLGYFTSVQKK